MVGPRVRIKRDTIGERSRPGSEGPCKLGRESDACSDGSSGDVIHSVLQFRWVTLAVAWRVAWRRGGSKDRESVFHHKQLAHQNTKPSLEGFA